jgi:IS5 family transposase
VKEKPKAGRRLSSSQVKRNRRHGAIRAKVEHVFRVLKCQFGYRKVRYRGIDKNGAPVFTLLALAKPVSGETTAEVRPSTGQRPKDQPPGAE